jgi:hypothetical protein
MDGDVLRALAAHYRHCPALALLAKRDTCKPVLCLTRTSRRRYAGGATAIEDAKQVFGADRYTFDPLARDHSCCL